MVEEKCNYLLIAEDDLDFRFIIDEKLKSIEFDFKWEFVTDGDELMKKLYTSGDQLPKMILLDLFMPKLNGFEVLAKIKKDPALQSIMVIVFTDSNNPYDIEKVKELGGDFYVRKPVKAVEIEKYARLAGPIFNRRMNYQQTL